MKKKLGYIILVNLAIFTTLTGCVDDNANVKVSSDEDSSHLSKSEGSQTSAQMDKFSEEILLQPLVDFNATSQKSWIIPSTSTFRIKDDGGINSLTIDFQSSENISKLRIQPVEPWQLSNIIQPHNLAVDVENPQDQSVHFYLALENPAGESQSRSISIEPHFKGTVYIPLSGKEASTETGFWGDNIPWQTNDKLMVWRSWRSENVDVKTIAALNFFTIGLLQDSSINIGNIRIRENPVSDPNWNIKIVDKFGQNAKVDFDIKIKSEQQLKQSTSQELQHLASSEGMPHRSRFGGYTNAPQVEATGYFRTQKIDGQWWMVDPDGYLFFSHGPANVRMANMGTLTGIDFTDDNVRVRHADETTPEDSMGIVTTSTEVRKTRYIQSSLRNNMFQWLPDYNDPLAKHYSYRRSTHKGAIPHGETYFFYRANLERKYGEAEFLTQWKNVTLHRMKDWGFTSFGNWVDPVFYEAKQVPYFANGWIIGDFKTLSGKVNHWGKMPDPYDPTFAERAKVTIKEVAEQVDGSPWCAGIFIDNEKSWGERQGSVEERYGLILDALSKNAIDSPAKKAFTDFLMQKYGDITSLNTQWNTQLSDWQQFEVGITLTTHSDVVIQDLSRMLELLGEQYFKVVHNTLESFLPHHLYMGARMANWGMPDEIIKASIKYSDVLSFNIYEEGMQTHFWKFLEQVDLPVVIGEFHIGSTEGSGLFNPGIVHASSQQDRADKYQKYMASILNKPYMVGAHWFQYVDEPITGRAFDGENANIGFVSVTDTPYPEMINAVKRVTSDMYQTKLTNRSKD